MRADFGSIVCKAELVLYELERLQRDGPSFQIVHRYRFKVEGARCQPGEEVSHVFLVYRGRIVIVRLSLALLLLFDYFACYRHLPQSASQIARVVRRSDFYGNHGRNGGVVSARKISRSAIKEYVKRIRKGLASAFQDAGLLLDPRQVLVSETSGGTEAFYQLKASVGWIHIDEIDPADAS